MSSQVFFPTLSLSLSVSLCLCMSFSLLVSLCMSLSVYLTRKLFFLLFSYNYKAYYRARPMQFFFLLFHSPCLFRNLTPVLFQTPSMSNFQFSFYLRLKSLSFAFNPYQSLPFISPIPPNPFAFCALPSYPPSRLSPLVRGRQAGTGFGREKR